MARRASPGDENMEKKDRAKPMFRRSSYLGLAAGWIVAMAGASHAAESTWVYPGADGQLMYHAQPNGDRIVDFSMVGYGFGQAVPDVATVVTVQPGAGDDTAAIQAAINQVAAMPIGTNGFRGAVQLGAGEFQVGTFVTINSSGIVLRGSGQDAGAGTVIRATGTSQRDVIQIEGSGSWSKVSGSEKAVLDKYVPVGATSFRVADAGSFNVGDRVNVYRPSTQAWIEELGMDQIPPRSDGGTVVQWAEGNFDRQHDRVVTRVEGDRVFLNAPITQSLDAQYGGGTLYKYNWSGRINHVGVENLRGVSDYQAGNNTDENHARSLIYMNRIEDGFVRDVTAEHFWYSLVEADTRAKNITVEDSTNLDPISIITGGRRYAFQNNSQLSLFRNLLSTEGRHDFVQNSPNTGPNVFVDVTSVNSHADTGPHQRWSTGALYDNVTVGGDELNIRNRGNAGTGHGWTGGNMVVWNSTAQGFTVQNPPTAQNWLIGSVGGIINNTQFDPHDPGIYDQHGANVDTRSLYYAQLADRERFADASFREYHLGDYDEFFVDGAGSRDAAPVDAGWAQDVADFAGLFGRGLGGFDDTGVTGFVPFTFDFQVDPGEYIAAATLTLALRDTGGGMSSKLLALERIEDTRSLAVLGYPQPITSTGSEIIVVQLLGVSLADLRDGRLNAMIGDTAAVDWARLDLVATPGVLGDYDGSGTLDARDVDLLFDALGDTAQPGDAMNLIADGQVNADDIDAWLRVVAGTDYGDLDLDGDVDLSDAMALAQNYAGVAGAPGDFGWADGDLDGDGDVDFADAMLLRRNYTGDIAELEGINLPEPTAGVLFLITGFSLAGVRH